MIAIIYYFLGNDRTWANKAHISHQNIEQLWKLIKARLTKETSNGCYTRIIFDLTTVFPLIFQIGIDVDQTRKKFIGGNPHRAKFQNFERLLAEPYAHLTVKYWAFVKRYEDAYQKHERAENYEQNNRQDNVQQSLADQISYAWMTFLKNVLVNHKYILLPVGYVFLRYFAMPSCFWLLISVMFSSHSVVGSRSPRREPSRSLPWHRPYAELAQGNIAGQLRRSASAARCRAGIGARSTAKTSTSRRKDLTHSSL